MKAKYALQMYLTLLVVSNRVAQAALILFLHEILVHAHRGTWRFAAFRYLQFVWAFCTICSWYS